MDEEMILSLSSYRRAFGRLSEDQKETVEGTLNRLEAALGLPHAHSGLGIRRFGNYFEARAGLGLRILFLIQDGDIILTTVGNHDQIRAFVKERR